MRISTLVLKCVICLSAGILGANAQTVRVNWQRNAPFADYKTYAWHITSAQNDSFYKQFVVQYADEALQKAGLTKVSESQSPALLIAYHFTTQELIDSTTTTDGFDWGVGGPWGPWAAWGGWGGWGGEFGGPVFSNTEERPRTMGILTIDLIDAKAKHLVWRGQATEDSIASTQKGDEKQVRKSVDKMFEHFPPK
ncbi:MAG: DUF4136 domain-containing protein [Acidobacteriaceae bacterium]|nr:DUF4136 domain-containing protein [Acidobacteriaceae bacterium]